VAKDTHLVRQEILVVEPNSYGYSLQGCDGHLLWLIDNRVSTSPRKMFHLTTVLYCDILETIILIFINTTTSKTTGVSYSTTRKFQKLAIHSMKLSFLIVVQLKISIFTLLLSS